MKNKIAVTLIALSVIFSTVSANFAAVSKTKVLPEIIKTGDENFDKIFREGRDLIDKEQWKEAAAKFKEIVCDCPDKKGVDAAFYWLAFTYKKQKMYAEMDETVKRLLKNFPNSSWTDDARVMLLQQNAFTIAFSPEQKEALTTQTFKIQLDSKTSLDREEEIKLAAFRSLLSSDANRGIQLAEDILKPESKASENFKIQVIRLLSLPGFTLGRLAVVRPVQPAKSVVGNVASAETFTAFGNNSLTQSLPQIREMLVKSYQDNSSVDLKKEILSALGRTGDENSIRYLSQLYNSETNKELKKTILRAFGDTGFYHSSASAKSVAVRDAAGEKLLEILKNEKDIELKNYALSSLQSRFFWSKNEGMSQEFSQIYNSVNDEDFKKLIIRALANFKQDTAIRKLLDIAKNDKSDNLRLEAIRSLQGSKNPEVIKFLEDLIK